MIVFVAFVCGGLFGFGLLVSGMANPAKVSGFLDIGGSWDPSLLFVMGGAIAVGLAGFALAKRLRQSLLGLPILLPTRRDWRDRRLIAGSALFGIGWALAGICPGPGLVLLGMGLREGLVFCAAMIAGMMIFERFKPLDGIESKPVARSSA